MNELATQHYALFQGDFDAPDEDAALLGTFSTEKRAESFQDKLSKKHTEMKREANEAREHGIEPDHVPDLYWDIRPVPHDPRDEDEL